ncbi:amino acid ABC transporter ATP-binding protein, partial [Rhodococcus hoagii]|nr:amino acid ABC transporter ATP-binding protein [Prescottella equi]
MISMKEATKHYGDSLLKDIDMEIPSGKWSSCRPVGSGKSTLCRTINRLEPIDRGSSRSDGVPVPAEGRALAKLRSD